MIRRDRKRICLFAGYNADEVIEDYVVYLIEKLSLVSDVYYLADNNVKDEELAKIAPYVKAAYGYKHGKYDFGSWQELIYKLGWEKLSEYDELILTNDSIIGPLYNIQILIDKTVLDEEWQVCGINSAYDYHCWHLSSYFLMMKKEVFLSHMFKEYIAGIKQEESVDKVIENYEIGFSRLAVQSGYTVKSIVEFKKNIFISWRKFIKKGSPFVKKKIFGYELYFLCRTFGWSLFMKKYTNFNINLIKSHIASVYKTLKYTRGIFNLVFWQYALKGAVKVVWQEDRKIIRIFGIYLLNKINYESNKITVMGK